MQLFYACEKYGFGKLQNSHISGNIGQFLEYEVSMETSVQWHSGFFIVTHFHIFFLTL